jgi:hypothetical protein
MNSFSELVDLQVEEQVSDGMDEKEAEEHAADLAIARYQEM